MHDLDHDTIAAVATASGSAGLGVIRISGKQSHAIAKKICQRELKARYAHYCEFYDDEQIIDQGIALFFQGPHSFTGEDVVELQAHGGPVLLNRLLQCVLNHGARTAQPGEFSKRAFLNDKIDLTQAEAIADLIEASSESAAQSAMNSLQGYFSTRVNELLSDCIQLRMYIEAAIDFPEEEIDFLQDDIIQQKFNGLTSQTDRLLDQAHQGSLLKDGIKVVIVGKPNAGKSSLLNALAQRDAAIVTNIQGTTRDILNEHILIDDLPVHLIDTAGLRQSDDIVEQEGIKRALNAMQHADLLLIVNDVHESNDLNMNAVIEDINQTLLAMDTEMDFEPIPKILVHNKIDLVSQIATQESIDRQQVLIKLSAKSGDGLDYLKQAIKDFVNFKDQNDQQDGVFSARARHIEALRSAQQHIQQALYQLNNHSAGEIVAEDLRLCQNALSEITGEFTSDDLLGHIFSSFCIGK